MNDGADINNVTAHGRLPPNVVILPIPKLVKFFDVGRFGKFEYRLLGRKVRILRPQK